MESKMATLNPNLSSIYQAISGQSSLEITQVSEPLLKEILRYSGVKSLALSAVTSKGSDDGQSVTISANTTFLNIPCAVVATFTVSEETGEVVQNWQFTPDAKKWSFQTAFPDLPAYTGTEENGFVLTTKPSYFYDLVFESPVFTIVTQDDPTNSLIQGLNFQAKLDLSGTANQTVLDPTILALAGNDTLDVSGTISYPSTGGLELYMDVFLSNPSLTIGSFQLDYFGFSLVAVTDGQGKGNSQMLFSGIIEFNNNQYVISAPLLKGNFVWSFTVEFPAGEFSIENAIDDIQSIFGIPADKINIPKSVQKLESFYIVAVTIGFDPKEKKFHHVTVDIASQDSWTIPYTDIVVSNPVIEYTYMAYDSFHGFISGDFQFGKATSTEPVFEGQLSLPDFRVEIELQQGQTIDLKPWIEDKTGASLSNDSILLSSLSLWGDLPDKQFGFYGAITGSLTFELGNTTVEIVSIDLSMTISEVPQIQFEGAFIIGVILFKGSFIASETGFDIYASYQPITGDGLAIGDWMEDLADKLGLPDSDFPQALTSVTLTSILLSYDSTTKNFTFECETQFKVDSKPLDLQLNIVLTHNQGQYEKSFSGVLTVDNQQFDVAFDESNTMEILLASYTNLDGTSTDIKTLATDISSDLGSIVPEGLSITLNDAIIAMISDGASGAQAAPSKEQNTDPASDVSGQTPDKAALGGSAPAAADGNGSEAEEKAEQSKTVQQSAAKSHSKYLLGANIGTGIDLTNLPLVGRYFSNAQKVQFNIQPLFATEALTINDIQSIQQADPKTGFQFPPKAIAKGFSITASMNIGGLPVTMPLNIGANADGYPVDGSQAVPGTVSNLVPGGETAGGSPILANNSLAAETFPQESANGISWLSLQKNFGPVHLQKVGVKYSNGVLYFEMDASLTAGGLNLSLIDLGIGSPITQFDPTFSLDGIGIDYQNDSINIGGMFMRVQGKDPQGKSFDEYDGMALIETSALGLSALGSYARFEGHSSLFLYAVLDKSLGGPSFFYVTGLVTGFGYNRNLQIPTINQVQYFPLVADAMTDAAPPQNQTDLMNAMDSLHIWIPPQVGEEFFAIGIKFSSFKLIDSFALLTVKLGEELEVDVLGLSNLILPTPDESDDTINPLAEVQMALKAFYIPSEGFIGVQAQLTSNSYVLSQSCHLTGGFALYSWLDGEHSGDFVVTLGGYHPKFIVPSYYPVVPRLGFNWQVDSKISLNGELYFALVPHAVMAGGSLSAVFKDGNLSAWFEVDADFIIGWQPYYYEADVYLDFGVSYRISVWGIHHIFQVSVGASLELSGPDFGGYAELDICGFHPAIHFGNSTSSAKPISWTKFRDSFLPALPKNGSDENLFTDISASKGLQREVTLQSDGTSSKVWIIDPDGFVIKTNSLIPALNGYQVSETGTSLGTGASFAIGSMGITDDKGLTSDHIITVTYDEKDDVTNQFAFTPATKNLPAGMWGTKLSPGVNDSSFIENALTGYTIQAPAPSPSKSTQEVDKSKLAFNTIDITVLGHSTTDGYVRAANPSDARTTIQTGLGPNSTRTAILTALGFSSDAVVIHNAEATSNVFIDSPEIFTKTGSSS